jgi:hypothetical protein
LRRAARGGHSSPCRADRSGPGRGDRSAGASAANGARLPRRLRRLANEWMLTEDGPHPTVRVEPTARPRTKRRSHRPCHPRATSSGHQRYLADSRGHSGRAVALGDPLLTCAGETGRNCMACKRSSARLRCQQSASNRTPCSLAPHGHVFVDTTAYLRRHSGSGGQAGRHKGGAKSSHGRSHRFNPCHAHEHKQPSSPLGDPRCQQIVSKSL